MSDLIVYAPNHGYSDDTYVYVSWLDGYYYIQDKDEDTFKLSVESGSSTYIQYTSGITEGYVREGAAGSTTISGLDNLNGENVYVVANGTTIGLFTVSGGQITLSQIASSYRVGLPYSCKIKTTRLAVPPPNTYQSRIKRINETTVRHWKTQGGSAGQEYNGVEYLTDLDAEYSNRSSDSTFLTRGGFSEDGYTVIKSNDPYPMTVLATIINVELYE